MFPPTKDMLVAKSGTIPGYIPNPAKSIYGIIYIGTILNICFYGGLITQTFHYFKVYWDDRRWLKCFVAFIFTLVTIQSIVFVYWLYHFLIDHWGDDSALLQLTWECALNPSSVAVIGGSVQLFYARRIWVLMHNFIIVSVIVALSIMSTGFAIASSFVTFHWIAIVWLSAAAATDVLITSVLVWQLRRYKSGYSPTDHIVDRMIRLSMQTGVPTAVCAVFDLATYIAFSSRIHLLFSAPLGVLYACTLMANLNARKDFKFDNTAVITVESQPVYRASLLSTAKIPVDVIELQQPESQNRSSSGSNIMQSEPKSEPNSKYSTGSILFAQPDTLSHGGV